MDLSEGASFLLVLYGWVLPMVLSGWVFGPRGMVLALSDSEARPGRYSEDREMPVLTFPFVAANIFAAKLLAPPPGPPLWNAIRLEETGQ
jgi:hypothetical protein